MTYLNGFSEDQLNDAEFVDNFVDEPVVRFTMKCRKLMVSMLLMSGFAASG